jgi:pyrroloquinoline quinone biosynthesis protein D
MTGIAPSSRPRLARGVRLREDRVRGGWNVLAPERVLRPNPVAVEVLKLCDGARSFDDIVSELGARFQVERERIVTDASALLVDLAEKRMVEL